MLKLFLSSSWTLAKSKGDALRYSHQAAGATFPLEAASESGAKQRRGWAQGAAGASCFLFVEGSTRVPGIPAENLQFN